MKKIGIVTKFSWVGISTSVLNTARFWAEKGYSVDLLLEQPDIDRFPLPLFESKLINIIIVKSNKIPILNDIIFCYRYLHQRYIYIIAFDCEGLIRAGFGHIIFRLNIIYHSLEFYEPSKRSITSSIKQVLEKVFAQKSKFVFSQSIDRLSWLQRRLGLNQSQLKLIYNSPIGKIIVTQNDYFRKKYGISPDVKIILIIGSIIKEHFVEDLINELKLYESNYVFIFHGWFPDQTLLGLLAEAQKESQGKIELSKELFSDDDKYIPYTSCDLGFVGFKPITDNLKYAAGSAGKLFDFMRTGVPVIANDIPGMRELVTKNGIGDVFNDIQELPKIIQKLLSDYKYYSRNSKRAFDNYEFVHQYQKVYNEII